MRVGYSLGSLLSINEIIECARLLATKNPHSVWIPETWGMEIYSMLSTVSQIVQTSKIGSSIINIYSRTPTLVAMGAATLDTISNSRFILGVGTSSEAIVQDWHGLRFDQPVERMREFVYIVRLTLTGKKVNHNGKFFKLRNFNLLINQPKKEIPIYLAAVNKKMMELAWEIGDGVIFYLRPLSELRETISMMQSRKKIVVASQFITCVSADTEKAIERAKKTLAFYISTGKIYRDFLAKNGFKNEVYNIFEEFKNTGLKSNYDLIPKHMLDSLTICGNVEDCRKKLEEFVKAGVTLPIIQFNPLGNTMESFRTLLSATQGNEI